MLGYNDFKNKLANPKQMKRYPNFYRFPPTQESPYWGTGTNPKYLRRY